MSSNNKPSKASQKNKNQSTFVITPHKYSQEQRKQSSQTQYGTSFQQNDSVRRVAVTNLTKKQQVSAIINQAQKKVKDSFTGMVQKVTTSGKSSMTPDHRNLPPPAEYTQKYHASFDNIEDDAQTAQEKAQPKFDHDGASNLDNEIERKKAEDEANQVSPAAAAQNQQQ